MLWLRLTHIPRDRIVDFDVAIMVQDLASPDIDIEAHHKWHFQCDGLCTAANAQDHWFACDTFRIKFEKHFR